ncbi:MAG TPA: MRP family ATP-binding protein [Bacteroidetes bacterium]|nr:MRP family ATP-binding protein [Bacteroidota bacterium]
MISKEQLSEILKNFNDPDLNTSFTELNFLKSYSINGDKLKIDLFVSDENNPSLQKLSEEIGKKVISEFPDFSEININFNCGVVEHIDKKKSSVLPGIKNTIAVASGKGGVGKSTAAVNLAVSLAKLGYKTGIIDADIYGPSIPTMFDIKEKPKIKSVNGKNKLVPVTKYDVEVMSIGFLIEGNNAVVWRGPMASSALKQFMGEVVWSELDFLIFDMPPGTGDIQLTLSQTIPLTGAIIVTTPQEISLIDAKKGFSMFEKVNVQTIGIIENMSYYNLPDGSIDYIFGKDGGKNMCDELGIPLLGQIPINKKIREGGDLGKPVSIFEPDSLEAKIYSEIAKRTVNLINQRNIKSNKSPGLEIKL